MPLGSIISAIGGIAGGLLGASSAKSQQKANYEAQKEFAQHGIRWKVTDAKAAGVHPLFALGGNTASYTPNAISAGDYGLASAGQDIGNAVNRALAPKQQKANAAMESLRSALDLEGMRIQNRNARLQGDLIQQQIMDSKLSRMGATGQALQSAIPGHKVNQPQHTPGYTLAGMNIKSSPWFSDAQSLEDRGGEPLSWAMSPFVTGSDVLYTLIQEAKDLELQRKNSAVAPRNPGKGKPWLHWRGKPANPW